MPNLHRGEIEAELGGRRRRLVLTLGALAELEAALAARDSETAACLLHGFKGSAAYLDDMALHLLCGELEAAADHGRWQLVQDALPGLRQSLEGITAHAK